MATELTEYEKATWIRFLAAETRTDFTGVKAQRILTHTLDGVAEEPDGWCDCRHHREAVRVICRLVWRKPPE